MPIIIFKIPIVGVAIPTLEEPFSMTLIIFIIPVVGVAIRTL